MVMRVFTTIEVQHNNTQTLYLYIKMFDIFNSISIGICCIYIYNIYIYIYINQHQFKFPSPPK